MQTLNTLNKTLVANKAKINTIKLNNSLIITEAIVLVEDKITSLITNYNITDRKAIKVIQDGMFTPINKEDKLSPELKKAIKIVVISHKRDVYNSILWNDLSVNTINEVLIHLTIKEIKSCTDMESFKDALKAKKTRTVETLAYAKAVKKQGIVSLINSILKPIMFIGL